MESGYKSSFYGVNIPAMQRLSDSVVPFLADKRTELWLHPSFDSGASLVLDVGSNRTFGLQDAQNLVASNNSDLGDAVGVAKSNTNLRRSGTLASELADLVDDLGRSGLQPSWRVAAVGEGRGRDTLSLSLGLDATHVCGVLVVSWWCWSSFAQGG